MKGGRPLAGGAALALLLSLVLPGLVAGCGSDLASPFSAVVVAYDAGQARYKLARVRISTLTSLKRLQGSSGTVLANGAAHPDPQAFAAAGATVASLRAQLFSEPASPVDLSWNVVNDGLVYPENYASLELLSAYANLERARAAFSTWGLKLQTAPVFAHTALLDGRGLSPLADGELYYPPLGAFFLPAPSVKAQLPLHFNLGAVGHGLALQAWQQVVWNQKPVDPASAAPATDPDALSARHTGASVAQGLADFLGAAVSRDPRWFDHSVQQQAGSRALDVFNPTFNCASAAMIRALDVPDATLAYNPYPLGTVLAYCLWETLEGQDDTLIAKGARNALAALAGIAAAQSANGGKLALAAALEALVAATPDDRKPDLCGSLHNRFTLVLSKDDLPSCKGVVEVAPLELCQ